MYVLTREREARGWSKSELARRAQMSNSTVGAIESGRLTPYESQLRKLADALCWDGGWRSLMDITTEQVAAE